MANNMVLQQNDSVMLWGWAAPGEKIRVTTSWNGRLDSVVTTRDAKWQLKVKTPAAGGPYDITLQGRNTVKLQNVLIGEVWICSGQSNMEWSGNHGLKQIKAELPVCADANIRFFHVPKTTAAYPQDDAEAAWALCDSNTLKSFSAVAYYFGKKLRKDLDVPIGLINASWGGTPAEVWTPAEEVTTQPALLEAAGKLAPSNNWPPPARLYLQRDDRAFQQIQHCRGHLVPGREQFRHRIHLRPADEEPDRFLAESLGAGVSILLCADRSIQLRQRNH